MIDIGAELMRTWPECCVDIVTGNFTLLAGAAFLSPEEHAVSKASANAMDADFFNIFSPENKEEKNSANHLM